MYPSDACQVHLGWFPLERHVVGKEGAVNRNERLYSAQRTREYTKRVETLVYSLAPVCWRRQTGSNTSHVENTRSPAGYSRPRLLGYTGASLPAKGLPGYAGAIYIPHIVMEHSE